MLSRCGLRTLPRPSAVDLSRSLDAMGVATCILPMYLTVIGKAEVLKPIVQFVLGACIFAHTRPLPQWVIFMA